MDRRIIYLLVLVGFVSLSSFEGCSNQEEVQLIGESAKDVGYDTVKFDMLQEAFAADSLPNQSLVAFEQRAIIQLQDYASLVEMITNKNIKRKFRKQGAKMIEGLFASNDVMIEYQDFRKDENKEAKLKKYLKTLTKGKTHLQLKFTELKVIDHLRLIDDNLYVGNITYTQTANSLAEDSIVSKDVSYKKAEIIVRIVEKQFGKQTAHVWSVRLGSISVVELLVGDTDVVKGMGDGAI